MTPQEIAHVIQGMDEFKAQPKSSQSDIIANKPAMIDFLRYRKDMLEKADPPQDGGPTQELINFLLFPRKT
ncbi:hypothetical protein [Prosthecobacter sp.]|uniref:hypothetical protein n=1 Tax=Prosthecobacter sp. TaxID=1965333 RepID=UPI003783C507